MTYEINKEHKYKKSTIIAIGQDKPAAAKERHYVDKEEFYQALVERKALMDEYRAKLANGEEVSPPRISEKIGECVLKICTNLSKKFQFAKIPYKEEMISDAIEQCLRYIDSFDVTKTRNPFSYFTQTAYYQYLDRIEVENEELYKKYKALLDSVALAELSEHDASADNAEHIHDNFELPDISHITDFVGKYEIKIAERKKKQKEKSKQANSVNLDDIWAS